MATEIKKEEETPTQNINTNGGKYGDKANAIVQKLTKEIESLKEIIQTKDYIIDDLFTELSKVGDERIDYREKYEIELMRAKKANEKITYLENKSECHMKEMDELNVERNCPQPHYACE